MAYRPEAKDFFSQNVHGEDDTVVQIAVQINQKSQLSVIMPPRRKRKQTTSKHSIKTETHAAETANASSIQPAAEEVTVLPVVADVEPVEQAAKKSKTDGADADVQEEEETAAQEPV